MAKIYEIKVDGKSYMRLRDIAGGRRFMYIVDLKKHTAKQWISAHKSVMLALTPEQRKKIRNTKIRDIVEEWLDSPKNVKDIVNSSGIKIHMPEAEHGMEQVIESYLNRFCDGELNSQTAIAKAKSQCKTIMEFLSMNEMAEYKKLTAEAMAKYPQWRASRRMDGRQGKASADTVNKEINRIKAVIRHGIKYHGWQERYLLDGIRVKPTPHNTKAIRPFDIGETKKILEWLRAYSAKIGNWHLHDMALLALCAGLEAKALDMLAPGWVKRDLGVLRVYDKLVSGVIDAKTQNRARDIPLTPTLRKIFERGHVFSRPARTHRPSRKGGTRIFAYSRSIFAACERDTGAMDVNWHRFRHTCATVRLSAGWQLVRVSRMMGHSRVNTTASHYAEYDLSASPSGFEGMVAAYGEFARWLDDGYFADSMTG